MHEYAVTQQIAGIALETARLQGALAVTSVRVRVGNLTGIVEGSMRFYFDALTEGTPAAGGALVVEPDPARGGCRSCGWQGAVEPPLDPACPACGQWTLSVEGGRDLVVVSVEVADEPGAPPPAKVTEPLAHATFV